MQLKTCERCTQGFLAQTSRARFCDSCYGTARKADRHKTRLTEFRALDGEGIGNDYVLLGIGQDQWEWPSGVDSISSIFAAVYADFQTHSDAYYGGFYLGYDWNNWFKLLPRERIRYLIDPEFIAKRQRKRHPGSAPFPVDYEGWEFDWLPGKRFKLRPQKGSDGWFYLNDWGPFFQMSLLKALKGRSPLSEITDEMVEDLRRGKERRSVAVLDDEMRRYNRLENYALECLMGEVDHSLSVLGTPLGRTEYHGPGQAAQKWILKQLRIKAINKAVMGLPSDIYDPIVASYYGGIFEIVAHGHVPGTSYEYDINSAYPYQISKLPCVCGTWSRTKDGYTKLPPKARKNPLVLVHAHVWGSDTWLGPMPHRTPKRAIMRPHQTVGWYWKHELEAAYEAGLVDEWIGDDWVYYNGCEHDDYPLRDIEHLYGERLRVGKETAVGKGCKLIYNSAYGKFAQSIGSPQASNAVYASLITAGCRVQILNAIASHPERTEALLMIATDAVYFTSLHPGLPLSNRLGEWEMKTRENMLLFKPGMYWDDASREAIRQDEVPAFKARGVNAKDFARQIFTVDTLFAEFHVRGGSWPSVKFPVEFAQVSCKQAYQATKFVPGIEARDNAYRERAGKILTNFEVEQSSDPTQKRRPDDYVQGLLLRTHPYPNGIRLESTPYDARFGRPENELGEMLTEELPLDNLLAEGLQLR